VRISYSALGFRPRDAFFNHLSRFGGVASAQDLGPFVGLQILVVGEEVFDLAAQNVGQVGIFVDAVMAGGDMGRRHGDDFLILAGIVFHQQHADRPHADDRTGLQRPGVADQDVHRIAIARGGASWHDIAGGLSKAQRREIDSAVAGAAMEALAELGVGVVVRNKRGTPTYRATGDLP
jgi:hypothetical protein